MLWGPVRLPGMPLVPLLGRGRTKWDGYLPSGRLRLTPLPPPPESRTHTSTPIHCPDSLPPRPLPLSMLCYYNLKRGKKTSSPYTPRGGLESRRREGERDAGAGTWREQVIGRREEGSDAEHEHTAAQEEGREVALPSVRCAACAVLYASLAPVLHVCGSRLRFRSLD